MRPHERLERPTRTRLQPGHATSALDAQCSDMHAARSRSESLIRRAARRPHASSTHLQKPVVKLKRRNDARVVLGADLELLQSQLVVRVLVHRRKDLLHALLGCVLVGWHFGDVAHHQVNRRDDLCHFLARDHVVVVDVVQLERPLQLLIERASRCDRERADELRKVDAAIAVLVENPEHVLREGACISEGKELAVNLLELFEIELARRQILNKAFVPALQLLFVEVCVVRELLQLCVAEA
eukprot:Amastigsp_a167_453.p1 type:complete len:241 gc:universal Amastigsp_a167_453:348-1070(+)